jgi:hypothetical protein
MALKDHASLIISGLALTISGATAYYTTFSERLDVRAALTDAFVPLSFGEGTLKGLHFDTRLVLINSGNRAVALTDLLLTVHQIPRNIEAIETCEGAEAKSLHGELVHPVPGSFSALVVKPMDVTVVPIRFVEDFTRIAGARLARPGDPGGFQPAPNDPEGRIKVLVCLKATYAAPGERLRQVSWLVARAEGEALGKAEGGAESRGGVFEDDRTAPLVKEARGVLW